jgi:phosphatidylglycerophosphatase A
MKEHVNSNIYKQIATLGKIGYLPYPGTMGSLAALPVVFGIHYFHISLQVFVIAILFCSLIAYRIIQIGASHFANTDPREIILDEVIGCLIAFYGLALQASVCISAFVLFRILDGTKWFGISYIEKKIPGAYGILCDDILAGLMVNIGLRYVMGI